MLTSPSVRVVLTQDISRRLKEHLFQEGKEQCAWLLFKKVGVGKVGCLAESARYLSTEILPVFDVLSSSQSHISFKTHQLVPLLKKAKHAGLTIGFAHSHYLGNSTFSLTDDVNEQSILRTIFNRNGAESELLSLILTDAGDWRARIRRAAEPEVTVESRHLIELSEQINLHTAASLAVDDARMFDRQSIALGEGFTEKIRSMRAVIVGAGGTGSAVAALLGRLGLGEIVFIDGDRIETSNLNRVHGSSASDVAEHRFKAEIQKRFVESMGTGVRCEAVCAWLDEPRAIAALATADVIFGCTDDHYSRQLLNRAVYFWSLPLFDVGLDASVTGGEKERRLSNLDVRVSIVFPEKGKCLQCQKVINADQAAADEVRRRSPHDYAQLVKEAYIRGGGQPDPAVVPYTTLGACLAVDEFVDSLVRYKRRPHIPDNKWIQVTVDAMRSLGRARREDCPFCGTRKFLNASERDGPLGRPSLRLGP